MRICIYISEKRIVMCKRATNECLSTADLQRGDNSKYKIILTDTYKHTIIYSISNPACGVPISQYLQCKTCHNNSIRLWWPQAPKQPS